MRIIEILVSVRRLPVYVGGKASIMFSCNCCVEEGEFVVSFLLHVEANFRAVGGLNAVGSFIMLLEGTATRRVRLHVVYG